MEKIDALRLAVEFNEIRAKHAHKMGIIARMGWLYSYLISTTGDDELNEALKSLQEELNEIGISTDNYLFGSLLISIITEVELFFVDTLYSIIKAFPKKIKNMKFDFNDIVDKSNAEIIQVATQRYINELMYKKPLEYLESFCKIVSIDSKNISGYWPNFIEAKARRDLGIHSNWTVNEIYLNKLKDVNLNSELLPGETIYPDNEYMILVHDNCVKLIDSINVELEDKFGSKKA